jgi:hypothetical protein
VPDPVLPFHNQKLQWNLRNLCIVYTNHRLSLRSCGRLRRATRRRPHFAFSQHCDSGTEYACLSVKIACLHLSKYAALSFLSLIRVGWLTLPALCATNSALLSFPPAALQMRSERAASRYQTFPAILSELFSTHPRHFLHPLSACVSAFQ